MSLAIAFDNSYARLPERFYARLPPTPVAAPRLIKVNHALADDLGLDWRALESPAGVEMLAGQDVPEGAASIALAYAGHQFGNFVPQLGDGRALLVGEVVARDGRRFDIQLKGSGPTPFSRRGDGRAAVGPVLREYLVSEAMHAMGVPTTRSLAAVTTGEHVFRETVLPGAVLTRVAASHVRVGTFQYFAARGDTEGVKLLVEHVIARHYPDVAGADVPALALLEAVVERQARLVARWMSLGFVHGVMNTDNSSIAGETIDYGPCAFMEAYDPETVFSSIDQTGRYAYTNQPLVANWNMARLAECLLPLLAEDEARALERANAVIGGFRAVYAEAWTERFRAKLGLTMAREGDGELILALLSAMATDTVDFTIAFRALSEAGAGDPAPVRDVFVDRPRIDAWLERWRSRLEAEGGYSEARRASMLGVNPAYIPRNHRVEEAIEAATLHADFAPFERLLAIVTRPFDEQPEAAAYRSPAADHERVERTFCGT